MYYLELLQRFWDFNQRMPIGSTAISMYLYLLKTGYDHDRYDFQISDAGMSYELGLTRKTVKLTKEKLKNLGLIRFQTKNGLPCSYRLILDYPLRVSEPENAKKTEIKTEQFAEHAEKSAMPSATISPIQNLPLNNSRDIEIKSSQTGQSPKPPSSKPLSPSPDIAKNIPSLDEVMEYAKTIETYEPYLDSEIKLKYEDWKNNNWRNSSDRPITNWKSSLKSSLPFMNNQMESHHLSLQSIPHIKRPKSQNDN